jgi:hypothetical protein
MPGTDEDILRELMGRATSDLHASPAITARVLTRQRRRRWRSRAVSVAVTSAAAGTVAGVVASGAAGAHSATASGGAPGGIKLTAAQHALYQLSSAAAAAPVPAGRYVQLTEEQSGDASRTSVIDSRTGDVWTYQQGPGIPGELPMARSDSPTQAQFARWPTNPAALRMMLLVQVKQQQIRLQKGFALKLSQQPATLRQRLSMVEAKMPPETSYDLVFEQATDTLWNPLVGPQLRAALYKVLAETPGVTVRTNTTDMRGRPATEISRVDNMAGEITSTFEDPATGAVLESLFVTPPDKVIGATGSTDYDLYLSITTSATLPANPYTK